MRVSRPIQLAAIVLATGLAARAAAAAPAGNPLLGKWVAEPNGYVDRNGFAWCAAIPRMEFTPTAQTMYAAATKFRPAAQGTTQVHYLVSGNIVYVASMSTFVGAPKYTILGPNEIQTNDVGGCKYKRQ
jgi:hypothetical protein